MRADFPTQFHQITDRRMAIDPQQLINSPLTVRFVFLIARAIPPSVAYPACDRIADWVARHHQSSTTRAVRLNQWVARGASLDRGLLDEAVRDTLRNNVRDLYDLYHHIDRPEVIERRICLNQLAARLIRRPEFGERGLVIVGLHLSNFDSVMQSVCRQGLKPLILTIPDPQAGRRVEYELRKRTGLNLVPASVTALRQAVRHLEQGGLVLTGMDRPVAAPRLRPRFFGQPASLPVHSIYLALKARVPVVIMAAIRQEDGKYNVQSSEVMEMEKHSDHDIGALRNAEMVLEQAEEFIRLAPQQWNVPLPVWPELLDQVPD